MAKKVKMVAEIAKITRRLLEIGRLRYMVIKTMTNLE